MLISCLFVNGAASILDFCENLSIHDFVYSTIRLLTKNRNNIYFLKFVLSSNRLIV